MNKVLSVIVATAVLHNIARRRGDLLPVEDPTLQLPSPWEDILENGNISCRNNESNRPGNNNNVQQQILINDYCQR